MESLTNTLETINKGRWQYQSNPDPWSKTESPQWKSYSLDQNYLIEKAYYDQQREVDLGDYLIYPLALLQRKKGNPEAQRPIRRINWIDDEEAHNRSARYFESELPKTINRIFGGLSDFISFFSRRNKEILEFTSHFQELEKSNDLNILNQKIIPKLVECLEEVLLRPHEEKLKDPFLTQFKKKMLVKAKEKLEDLISPFKKQFSSFEELYGQILRAYTMNTDLYPDLNKYLRNESWMEVDKLLPYAFCLCKAFFHLKLEPNLIKLDPGRQNPSEEINTRILYRGTAFDEFALSFYDIKRNKYFSWNAITSTTTNKKLAEEFMYNSVEVTKKKDPVMFIIEIPENTEPEEYLKWLDIRQYSAIPKEDEVILPPGSVFELLEVFTDQEKKTTIRIQLKNEVQSLAHKGLMMQGSLQSQMMTERKAKIMCLDGEELSQALTSMHGNQLIEEIEFYLCTFNDKLQKTMLQILPTIDKLKTFKFFSCIYESSKEVIIEKSKDGKRCNVEKIEVMEAKDSFRMICNEIWNQQYWDSLRELVLDFRSQRNLIDEELNRALSQRLKYLPQLAHFTLNLDWCEQVTDEGVQSLVQGLISLTQLTHLDLNFGMCKQITDEGVRSLAKGLDYLMKLTHLDILFFSCEKITDQGVSSLAKGLGPQLVHLNLLFSGCKLITDAGVHSLAQGLNSISEMVCLNINFNSCEQITEEGVSHLMSQGLTNMTKLTYLTLNFFHCEKITSQGLYALACQWLHCLIPLISLTVQSKILSNTNPIQSHSKFASFGSWTRLVRKNLHQNKQNLSEEVLKFQKIPRLGSLFCQSEKPLREDLFDAVISMSEQNQDHSFHTNETFSQISLLTSLNLDFKKHFQIITDDFVHNLASQVLKYLPQLNSLTLIFEKSDQITDKGVSDLSLHGFKSLTNLTSLFLDFKFCTQITGKGVSDLACEGLKHLSQLKSLTLSFHYCPEVTDEGMINLSCHGVSHLSQLESFALSLNSCKRITDEGLDSIVCQGLKNLTQLKSLTLDLSGSNISDKGANNMILQVIKNLSQLTLLLFDVGNCDNISHFKTPQLVEVLQYFGFTKGPPENSLLSIIESSRS